MKRRRHTLFWVLFPLLCLLVVAASALLTYWRHTVPLSQTSEVYRRYRDLPGIRAAYIRQMPINDTLRLDMTLFEAEDSLSYTNFLRTIGKREELIRDNMSLNLPRDMGLTRTCRRGIPASIRCDLDNDANNEVTIDFPGRFVFVVIHTRTAQDVRTVFEKAVFNEIDIDQR